MSSKDGFQFKKETYTDDEKCGEFLFEPAHSDGRVAHISGQEGPP